jgi:hypothetical protein
MNLNMLEAQGDQWLQQQEANQYQTLMQMDLQAAAAQGGVALQFQQAAQSNFQTGLDFAADAYQTYQTGKNQ